MAFVPEEETGSCPSGTKAIAYRIGSQFMYDINRLDFRLTSRHSTLGSIDKSSHGATPSGEPKSSSRAMECVACFPIV